MLGTVSVTARRNPNLNTWVPIGVGAALPVRSAWRAAEQYAENKIGGRQQFPIKLLARIPVKARILDVYNDLTKTAAEVKSGLSRIYNTAQIRDMMEWCKDKGVKFVKNRRLLSKPLARAMAGLEEAGQGAVETLPSFVIIVITPSQLRQMEGQGPQTMLPIHKARPKGPAIEVIAHLAVSLTRSTSSKGAIRSHAMK